MNTPAPFPLDLSVREANYCFTHFLNLASAYYAAALPPCQNTLSRAARLREEHAPRPSTPSRVQPRRRVKRRAAPEVPRGDKIVKRRVRNLPAGMQIPVVGGMLMGEGEWRAEVKAVAERAITEKVVRRYRDGPAPCSFGGRTWRCKLCDEEFREGRRDVGGDGGVAPVVSMEGMVRGQEQPADWWGVVIPEAEVVGVGGLRFVVDVCGHSLLMFV